MAENNKDIYKYIANSPIGKMILKGEKIFAFNKINNISENKSVTNKNAEYNADNIHKENQGLTLKNEEKNKSIPLQNKPKTKYWHDNEWKEGVRRIGNTNYFYRSSWEANYARYLEYLRIKGAIKGWQHEPDTFYFNEVKRGLKAYIPDFKIFLNNGTFIYHEVKGYMDSKAKTKLKRFAKFYPNLTLIVIDSKWFNEFKKSGIILEGWEN